MDLRTELRSPSPTKAIGKLKEALSRSQLTLVVGNCRVQYEGRAASTLEWGERLVIIKSDGSLLIHRPFGYEPVNWQPPKCVFRAEMSDEKTITLVASRLQPREQVIVSFHQIDLLYTSKLKDDAEFALHVTEEQMKRAILAQPDLVEPSFSPLQEERDLGESGFTDIIGQDNQGNLVVVEIKRHAASKDAVLQLKRYVDNVKGRVDRPVRGVLAAPSLRKGSQSLLSTFGFVFRPLLPERCFEVLKSSRTAKISEFID